MIFPLLLITVVTTLKAQEQQGMYFSKNEYRPKPLPEFRETREKLPQPIYDEDTAYVSCYWKTWELAFGNIYAPGKENGFVSQYIDAAFNANIFLWDMSFITMFARYGSPYIPAISALDNFYAKQHADGEICREIVRETGKDYRPWVNTEDEPLFSRFGIYYLSGIKMPVVYTGRQTPEPPPLLTIEGLNHPIPAWAELESYQLTADTGRLEMVWKPLVKYYEVLQKYLRQGNGLYIADWSQMDNSPRNQWLLNGGTAVDISSEMVLFARNLAVMAAITGKIAEAARYDAESGELSRIINEKMWDKKDGFYYDLTLTGQPVTIRTVGGFWPLIAGVADSLKASVLSRELDNKESFNRMHRVPTLAANEKDYDPLGGYWSGAVWAPTNTMIIRGLEKYGYDEQAAEIALNHLENVVAVYKKTGTLWENYAADTIAKGTPSRGDFVGWSGLGPVEYLIRYAIGIKANAPERKIIWTIRSNNRVGIRNFWFGGITLSMVCNEPDVKGRRTVEVTADDEFTLVLKYKNTEITRKIPKGRPVRINFHD